MKNICNTSRTNVSMVIAFIVLLICPLANIYAQGVAVNGTGTPPDASAMFEVASTTKGTLITRMTTAQRDAIASPAKGLMVYNLDCDNISCNTGTSGAPHWVSVFPSVNAPDAAGTISGTANVCLGQNGVSYSVANINNADTYVWSYSGTGASISGNTNPVTINFSGSATSGNLTVTGANACGSGSVSANYAITVGAAPSAPSGGVQTPSEGQIVWSWGGVGGATGYKYGTTNDYNAATDNGTQTAYTQTGLACSTNYTLYVWAYNDCGHSAATTLNQTTSSASTNIDATSVLVGTGLSDAFNINTTNSNEIILIYMHVPGGPPVFGGSISVSGTTGLTQIANDADDNGPVVLYACVANTSGGHNVSITWGNSDAASGYAYFNLAYAASFSGFCGTPSVAANVQATTSHANTSVTTSITPAAANSYVLGIYDNWNCSATGTVSWTNLHLIQTDHLAVRWDESLGGDQFAGTSPVSVTANDNVASCGSQSVLMLACVHP